MSASQNIFALRKTGQLDEAYQLVTEIIAAGTEDEWEIKACAWCLIDLIKREVEIDDSPLIEQFKQQLVALKIDPLDKVLQKQLNSIDSLVSPFGRLINQARELSKNYHFNEALQLYRQIFNNPIADQQLHIAYGWTLYRFSKYLWDANPKQNVNQVKRLLNEYFSLNTEKPSLLHTCILQLAKNLARAGNLRILPFFRIWGNHFREEDYKPSKDQEGKIYPSLAESILQMAGKEAIHANDPQLLIFIQPYLEYAAEQFKDNIWFKYYLAKSLLALGEQQQAKAFCINVCKAKQSESWAWGLLAEVYRNTDITMTIACYCKALLCKNEEMLKVKLRKNLAEILIAQKEFSKAKFELQTILDHSERANQYVLNMTQQDWFHQTDMPTSNQAFYIEYADQVDQIIYENLVWLNANMGEKFTIQETQKTKYKLFIKTESDTIETSVSKHMLRHFNLQTGTPLQVKGEFDDKNIFKVYLIQERENGQDWDALSTYLGIIDSVNHEKKVFHFIVDKRKDGVVPFHLSKTKVKEGDIIEVKTATYTSKSGTYLKVLELQPSTQSPSLEILKPFRKEFVETNGTVGFTASNYFIPPHLMKHHQIELGDTISGQAVLNFNTKKNQWGWKVLTVTEKFQSDLYHEFDDDID